MAITDVTRSQDASTTAHPASVAATAAAAISAREFYRRVAHTATVNLDLVPPDQRSDDDYGLVAALRRVARIDQPQPAQVRHLELVR